MDTSKVFSLIAEGLKVCGISENCTHCILLMIENDFQAQAILDWILQLHSIPTESECLEYVVMIIEKFRK